MSDDEYSRMLDLIESRGPELRQPEIDGPALDRWITEVGPWPDSDESDADQFADSSWRPPRIVEERPLVLSRDMVERLTNRSFPGWSFVCTEEQILLAHYCNYATQVERVGESVLGQLVRAVEAHSCRFGEEAA